MAYWCSLLDFLGKVGRLGVGWEGKGMGCIDGASSRLRSDVGRKRNVSYCLCMPKSSI